MGESEGDGIREEGERERERGGGAHVHSLLSMAASIVHLALPCSY